MLAKRSNSSGNRHRPVVLLEMTKVASAQLAHAFLATALATEHDAEILAYRFDRRQSVRLRVRRALRNDSSARSNPLLALYETFCDRVVTIVPTGRDEREARQRVEGFFASTPDLYALEAYAVNGAVLGDLIIDKHVQRGNPKIRLEHPGIRDLLFVMTTRALALHRFFAQHGVIAAISSGLAVSPAVPLRVALAHGVPAYPTTLDFTWRLTSDQPNWSRDYKAYRTEFAQLEHSEADRAREQAERFLAHSLNADGEGEKDLGSTSSWARRRLAHELLPEKPAGQRTVLVAAHSFSDSPHSIGNALFPDFFSWLEHLSGLAAKSDYEWLFKLHPDERDRFIGVEEEVADLLKPHKNAALIPSDISHWVLIERGVDLVLTIYGTIAVEYPALGIPAIVAWPDGFISDYRFALHPASVSEYDRLVLNPAEWDYPIPRDELLEYVYCRWVAPQRPGVFQRVPGIARHGEDRGAFKDLSFHRLWHSEVSAEDAAEVLRVHRAWIRSQTYSRNSFDQ